MGRGWRQWALDCVSVEVKVGKPSGADLEERLSKNSRCSSIKDRVKGPKERLELVPIMSHRRKKGHTPLERTLVFF